MKVIGILSATYPNGSLGTVTMIWDVTEAIDPLYSVLVTTLVDYYHQRVGPAYAEDDFSFTFWLAEDRFMQRRGEAFFWLVGEYMTTNPDLPDATRPLL